MATSCDNRTLFSPVTKGFLHIGFALTVEVTEDCSYERVFFKCDSNLGKRVVDTSYRIVYRHCFLNLN